MALARFIVELFARFRTSPDRQALGKEAEALVERYLKLKGYRILARNWRTRLGEIDLIAERGDTLVFIEVKARRKLTHGLPEEAVNPAKQKKLLTLARTYLSSYAGRAKRVRFDVIALDFSGKKPCIRHLEGVIEDGGT
ncbi:MAG TPA: YraN family protein [Thermodesulfobacteriaceae bacterium]|nr:YraN family protein [Thermodesulfobacteriaceae bacterium]